MSPRRQLAEVVLGRGDYSAGGACTQPFLDQDGARRRRPMVMGEVLGNASGCEPVLAEMFSGRASDPITWSVMWKEIGADGIVVRTTGMSPEDASALVSSVSDRTGLPVAVDGDEDCIRACASAVGNSTLMLIGDPDSVSCGTHAVAVPVDSVEECERAMPGRANRLFLVSGRFPQRRMFDVTSSIRTRALEGDEGCDAPIVFDVTGVWENSFPDARRASMVEAEAALTAMLSGADVLIVRGPGAADMARVYGEELADL